MNNRLPLYLRKQFVYAGKIAAALRNTSLSGVQLLTKGMEVAPSPYLFLVPA